MTERDRAVYDPDCKRCPRLAAYLAQAQERHPDYWCRPVAPFGDAAARIVLVGLAPGLHGANRTGRPFTGDHAGILLYETLHDLGLATQRQSVSATDGLRLRGARISNAVKCAPPENKPAPGERDTCAPWLEAELRMVAGSLRSIVVLGGFAWQALWPALAGAGFALPRRRPAFGHGAEVELTGPGEAPVLLIGCYHPSQQNTFTGRVTGEMTDAVFTRARDYRG